MRLYPFWLIGIVTLPFLALTAWTLSVTGGLSENVSLPNKFSTFPESLFQKR